MKYEKLTKDNYYHIFNRGNNMCDIFIEQNNYDYFLSLLTKYIIPIADIYSYCLLKNHFHLLVRINDIDDENQISQSFANMFNAYAKAINRRYNRKGSLFQRKFKRAIIDSEEYLREVIIYINLNPVYHKFVNKAEKYKYSSYNALVSNKPTQLKREEVIDLFEDKENFKFYINYKKNVFNERIYLEEE